jgi:hypothetical protein
MITKKSKYCFQFQLSLLTCIALVFSVLLILSLFTTQLSIRADDYHTALAVRPANVATPDYVFIQPRTSKANLSAFVRVVLYVDNTGGGTVKTSDFTPYATGNNNPFPSSFDGSEQVILLQWKL